ncbi:MAG: hypothetical protein KF817_13940 [Phycisphaeraceae bacterium]|nr:hypothetical protein [Phycisphaeraceae bacterium]
MTRTTLVRSILSVTIALVPVGTATGAEVTYFTDRALWESAVGGAFETITFTEHPPGVLAVDAYLASHGIEFSPGYSIVATPMFVNDGFGAYPNFTGTPLLLSFTTPQRWLAVDHAGHLEVSLYSGGVLIAPPKHFIQNGVGLFSALVSDTPFDHVVLRDPVAGVLPVDDLHFGGWAVPAPAALALLTLAPLVGGRRRRWRDVQRTGTRTHARRSPRP